MSWGRREPGLLGGEAGDGREPGGEEGEQLGHHRARGAPAQRLGRVAIDRVLADVEIERREIDGAEIVQLGRDHVEVEIVHRLPEHRVELGQAMQHPALELGHVGVGHLLRPPSSRRGCPAGSAACCAAGDRPRPGASGSPGRCAGPRCSRCRPPTGAGCRRRTGRTPFCGAVMLPSDFDILRPCSSSVKPCVSTPS